MESISACTLDESGREDRLGWIRREVLPHMGEATTLADGFAWECAAAGRETVERWVALERQCCGSVSWEVTPRADGSLRLEVRGDDPAVAWLASLVRSNRPGRRASAAPAGTSPCGC